MNISSSLRPIPAATQRLAVGPNSREENQPPIDKLTFLDGLESGGGFIGSLAGPIAGVKLGWKTGIEIAFRTGNYEAGPILLASAAVGGVVGYLAGQHAPHLVGRAGAFVSENLGGPADLGRAVGVAAAGTLLGGAAFGTVGAGVGAAVSVGNGMVQHFRRS